MEVKIGVQNAPRELVIETEQSPDVIERSLIDALTAEHGVFTLSDQRGRRIMIPVAKLGYLELGEPEQRRVGFG